MRLMWFGIFLGALATVAWIAPKMSGEAGTVFAVLVGINCATAIFAAMQMVRPE